jgi:hypothetical protein
VFVGVGCVLVLGVFAHPILGYKSIYLIGYQATIIKTTKKIYCASS